ncbi:MAG: homocysteine S-methyltransferase family protein [Gaiellales bacterium]
MPAGRQRNVIEGGIATRLMPYFEPGSAPDLLNLDRPDLVSELHRASRAAGATVLLTNTFGSNPVRLELDGRADDTEALNLAGVRLAREQSEGALVAGSLGPTGQLLEPLGPLTAEAGLAAFRRQARALADAGADLLVVETMYDLGEARAAAAGCVETGVPTILSFSYDSGTRTMMGVRPADTVPLALELGAAGIGFNCGSGLELAYELARELAEAARETGLELWARPNCGVPVPTLSGPEYPETPEALAAFAAHAASLGFEHIGACCGSTDAHVAAIAAAVAAAS